MYGGHHPRACIRALGVRTLVPHFEMEHKKLGPKYRPNNRLYRSMQQPRHNTTSWECYSAGAKRYTVVFANVAVTVTSAPATRFTTMPVPKSSNSCGPEAASAA